MSFSTPLRRLIVGESAIRIVLALTLLLAVASCSVPQPAVAQSFPLTEGTVAAAPRAIAHGVVTLPADVLAWRVATHEALPVDEAVVETFVDGFTVGTDGDLLIADAGTGGRDLIGADEATFNAAGTSLLVASAGDAATEYVRLGLVAAVDRDEATDGSLVLASDPFDAPMQPDGTDGFTLTLYGGDLVEGQTTTFSAGDLTAMLLVTAGSVSVSGADDPVTAGDAIAISDDTDLTGAESGSRFVIAAIGPAAPALPSGPSSPSASASASVAPVAAGNVVARTYLCADVPYWTADLSTCTPASDGGWDISIVNDDYSIGLDLDDATVDRNAAIWRMPGDPTVISFGVTPPAGYGHLEPVNGAGDRLLTATVADDGVADISLYFFPYGGDLGDTGRVLWDARLVADPVDGVMEYGLTGSPSLFDADGDEVGPPVPVNQGAAGPVFEDLPAGTYTLDYTRVIGDGYAVAGVDGPAIDTGVAGSYQVQVEAGGQVEVTLLLAPIGAESSPGDAEPSPSEAGGEGNVIELATLQPCDPPADGCQEPAGNPVLRDADGIVVPQTPDPSYFGQYWIGIPDGTYTLDLTGIGAGYVLDSVTGAEPTDDPLIYTVTVGGGNEVGVTIVYVAAS